MTNNKNIPMNNDNDVDKLIQLTISSYNLQNYV